MSSGAGLRPALTPATKWSPPNRHPACHDARELRAGLVAFWHLFNATRRHAATIHKLPVSVPGHPIAPGLPLQDGNRHTPGADLDAVAQSELGQYPSEMGLDRGLGDEEPLGDLGVGEAVGEFGQARKFSVWRVYGARRPGLPAPMG